MTTNESVQIPNLIQAAHNLRKRHQLKDALAYLQDADKVSRELPVKKIGGHIYNEMALVHTELKNYRQALWLVQHFVAYAKSLNLAKDITIGLETLALVQEKMGRYEQALQSFKEYHMIKDSLVTVEKSARVARVQTLYELEKKENTIQLLQRKSQLDNLKTRQQEQKLELAERQRQLYIISIGSLSLLILIVVYFLRRLFIAQQTLTWKKHRIETQAQQLQESNQLKDRLFSIVGHDLRSPVASIKNSFTLLKIQKRYPAELTSLEQEVNGLSQILDNILYWSLNQQNGLKVRQQWIELNDLVEDVLEGFTGLIRQKQLVITPQVDPVSVWADEHMTVLILRNIIHNACKFTPAGGGIRISTATESNQTRLRITDSGPGMNGPDINQLTSSKGTGIGLRLSKDLMHLNGGHLLIESQPGQGTVVTLSWPTKPA
ncbi:hypothetical protein GCM10027347_62170 [Larkinella harenae]